jgi:hypothetical protein
MMSMKPARFQGNGMVFYCGKRKKATVLRTSVR